MKPNLPDGVLPIDVINRLKVLQIRRIKRSLGSQEHRQPDQNPQSGVPPQKIQIRDFFELNVQENASNGSEDEVPDVDLDAADHSRLVLILNQILVHHIELPDHLVVQRLFLTRYINLLPSEPATAP